MKSQRVGSYTLVRMDRRHSGHNLGFKYRVEMMYGLWPPYNGRQNFKDLMRWAFENYGISFPLEIISTGEDLVWSWEHDENKRCIYLRNDEQASYFVLSFSDGS